MLERARRSKYLLPFAIGACVALTDQLLKYAVVACIQPGRTITAVPRLLSIRHHQNPVGAYGALTGLEPVYRVAILVVLPVAIFVGLIWTIRQNENSGRSLLVALSLILGGAIGNLIDRMALGHVTDFLVFRLGRSHSAAYNLADLSILAGMAVVLALAFRSWLMSEPASAEPAPPKTP